MSKQKKNSNYATEKRATAKAEAERKAKNKHILKMVLAISIPVLVITAIVLTLIFVGRAFGWWEKNPTVTQHAVIEVSGYGTLHVELYGEDAPETVAAFVKLVEGSKYNGIRFDRFADGKLETTKIRSSSEPVSIKGEFADNGVENNVKHKKGTLSMVLTDGADSANGEFFITTAENEALDGKYAAFGRIDADSMAIFEKILADLAEFENGGLIPADKRPKVTSIELHEAHSH